MYYLKIIPGALHMEKAPGWVRDCFFQAVSARLRLLRQFNNGGEVEQLFLAIINFYVRGAMEIHLIADQGRAVGLAIAVAAHPADGAGGEYGTLEVGE